MPFDLIELLSNLLRRHVRIVQVALFEFAVFGEEGLVVVEGFDYGVWFRWREGSWGWEQAGVEDVGKERDLLLSSGSARKR